MIDMAKNRNESSPEGAAVETAAAPSTGEATVPSTNRVLTFHREHPGNRASYTIAGVPGNCVIFRTLFADGVYPATITVDCALAVPQPKVDKSALAAERAAAKAAAAEAKLVAQKAKLEEKQRKADEALAKAKAKVDAANASKTPEDDAPAQA
jgi:hypothetical protein